jgi:hypothetical protein
MTLIQTLLLLLTMWSCSPTSQTTETSLDTMITTETSVPTTTTPPEKATVVSFSTSEGEMVTERVLTIELDGQTQVSVECSAGILLGDFEEKHTITSSAPAVTHNLRLQGLLAETSYNCVTTGAATNATIDFTTGSLPSVLVNLYETPTGTPQAGYMLFNTFGAGMQADHWLLIQDYWGNIRWYVDGSDGNGIIGLEYEPEAGGIIAGGGFAGNGGTLYPPSIYDLSGTLIQRIDVEGDHDIDYRNGSIYIPLEMVDYSCIQQWSIDPLMQTWEWCVPDKNFSINSIAVTEDEASILMTTYNEMEGVVKIDIKSGDTVWTFNPDGSGDFSVDTPVTGLERQHDVLIVECDSSEHDICMLVYDNGTAARGYSQILNYGFNETKMEANLLRSFTRKGWYEPHSGGVTELDNKEWLITIATFGGPNITSYLLVDEKGNELWEMKSSEDATGAYRARGIAPCDIFNHTGMCAE